MNKQGMTLAEVIVASVVLVTAVGGVMFIFSHEKGIVTSTGRKGEAATFAAQTLEELKNEVRADTWDDAAGALRVPYTSSWQNLSGDFGTKFSGRRRYTVESIPGADYRKVTVTVDWNEPASSTP